MQGAVSRPESKALTIQQGNAQRGGRSSVLEQTTPATTTTKDQILTTSHAFPLRPGKGRTGTRCLVKANHFLAEIQDKDLHSYNVTITPEATSLSLRRAIISKLVVEHKESYLGNSLLAYDGRSNLYTPGKLPFISKLFEITMADGMVFNVFVELVSRMDTSKLRLYLEGRERDEPHAVIQALDVVLRKTQSSPCSMYFSLGRAFYSPPNGSAEGGGPLGEGVEYWRGFYQTLRPTQMGLSLNINASVAAFVEPLPVIEIVAKLLNADINNRILSNDDRRLILKLLKGLNVKVTHRGNMQRRYRVTGLTEKLTEELTCTVDGKTTSLVDYFKNTYQYVIHYTHLPCLQVNNPKRQVYLPMEICEIVEGQKYSKRLNDRQLTALLSATCQRPKDKQMHITRFASHNDYPNDSYAQEFGIKIGENLATVEARILPTPRLKYHETGKEKDCLPQVGQWNMMKKKMVNGGTVENWICINFAPNVQDRSARGFCNELANACNIYGMKFNPEPVLPQIKAQAEQVERELKNHYLEAIAKVGNKDVDLLIAILPENNGSLYGDIKRICETEVGIVSQCCLAKNVFRISPQFLANMALKINVKVGGKNTLLVDALSRNIRYTSDRPTIIFGADDSHPSPGDDSAPSFAAVVASRDWPEISKYAALVSAQTHRQEPIDDLFSTYEDETKGNVTGGMIKEHLLAFHYETGHKPQRIIFYRDGVSMGQFTQVLIHELDAIRKACDSIQPDYQPPITFVVVQKGHQTRLFPYDHYVRRTVDRSGNVLPGTVVDTKICHPNKFDFYLCSHAGVIGTSRPTHYQVLWDENKFTADGLQTLTYHLCYSFARCTRSVSVVPPGYYADLAAFRARFYAEKENEDNGSTAASDNESLGDVARSRTTARGAETAVKKLPAIKENVKRVMFYC